MIAAAIAATDPEMIKPITVASKNTLPTVRNATEIPGRIVSVSTGMRTIAAMREACHPADEPGVATVVAVLKRAHARQFRPEKLHDR
jgi:hypothetical protein